MSLEHLLEARTVAVVGASGRPGSFGERLVTEIARSPEPPEIHLVNPRHAGTSIAGWPVLASIDEIDGPVDLVLLGTGDGSLEPVLSAAAARGDRSAVIFGSAVDPQSPGDSSPFRSRLAAIARDARMALCGGGCMGFVSRRIRAIGYLERAPLPAGPIAFVTHSGSAFSALLRTDRPFGFSLAVSSGQELVTTAAEYLDYALSQPETGVVALLLETLRAPSSLRAALARAAEGGIPVVALTVGGSEAGRAMVAAHSGSLAGSDGAWEALFDAYGVLRVHDLAEMCDTLELLVSPRRPPTRAAGSPGGVAAVLDSGAERALLVDVAANIGLGLAQVSSATLQRLAELLDPGLVPTNPLDVWGTGASTAELFTGSLLALAGDEAVDAVALAVDLVPEYDGDDSYRSAVIAAYAGTELPLCVLSNVPSALDREAAAVLRAGGIPVLEGTRSGLLALRHLLELRDFAAREDGPPHTRPSEGAGAGGAGAADDVQRADCERTADGGRSLLVAAAVADPRAFLAARGISSPLTRSANDRKAAVQVACDIGFPVVMKTAADIAHKTEAGGVVLGLATPDQAAEAYDRLARLGSSVTVSAVAPPGVELAIGIVRDPALGPLLVVGAGGLFVDLLADRAVALPPVAPAGARRLLDRLRIRPLLDGFRGLPPVDIEAVVDAITALSRLALELGDTIDALEVNPLSCSAAGVLALDVLVEASR